MRFEVARPDDDRELRRLLRENPMEGTISVTLEREPNSFLASTIEGDLHQTILARSEADGRVIGFGSRSVMSAFVNGEPCRIGYLGQLRIDRTQPSRRRLLAGGYEKLHELHADGAAPFYITTIIADNRPARRFLEAGLAGFPRYEPLAEIVTLVIPLSGAASRGSNGAPSAAPSGLGASAITECLERNGRRYQFARQWTADDLRCSERTRGLGLDDFLTHVEGGVVSGCVAVWDQTGFKQTVVRAYAPWLRRTRPALNLVSPLLSRPKLPAPGGMLAGTFASHLAVDEDDPAIAVGLLREACGVARDGGADYLMTGFDRRNPLLAAIKEAFGHREYVSLLYRVYWDDDAGSLPVLDGRITHVEVATL